MIATIWELKCKFIPMTDELDLKLWQVRFSHFAAFGNRMAFEFERFIRELHLACPKPAVLLATEIERSVLKNPNAAFLRIFQRKRAVPCTRSRLAGAAKQS